MPRNIFISRSLEEDSPIKTRAKEHNLVDRSLIEFRSLPFNLPETEWLFFYSKQGVYHFFSQLDCPEELSFKIACFGPGTAKYCSTFNAVNFVGNANSSEVLKAFEELTLGESVCFVCGEASLRSVHKNWKGQMDEKIVYTQSLIKNANLAKYDIAILTSPMNVTAFLSNGGSADTFIAIGLTTGKALEDADRTCQIAPFPSEEGLAVVLDTVLPSN